MSLAEPQALSAVDQLKLYLLRKGRPVWCLTVDRKEQITPRTMRVRFVCPRLHELEWTRGQDLVLELPQADGSIVRRHYTIRDVDRAARRLVIDFVLHGDSPAGRWLDAVMEGSEINAVGPRGRTHLRDADWHLFIGDETALPAILAMLEALPAGAAAWAVISIADRNERQAVPEVAQVRWVVRDGDAQEPRLCQAVEAFAFPPGRGQAYVLGETSCVRSIRQRLLARGLAKEQICAEGYWRPGRVGGHDHV